MNQSIPPGGMDQEMTRRIDASEGHGAGVCGLLVLYKEAFVAPNREASLVSRPPALNWMNGKDLMQKRGSVDKLEAHIRRKPKCRTMHFRCIP